MGCAVSVTTLPAAKDALQLRPQLIVPGEEVTVPVPEPLRTTVSV